MLADLHVHVHGCLRVEDIYLQGLKKQANSEQMHWYSLEFFKAYKRHPNVSDYWSGDARSAHAALRLDYCPKDRLTFDQFQASFNLLIASFPSIRKTPVY